MLDFETEYEMQGLFTLLENVLGQHLPVIARSFEQTHNPAIAQCLQQLVAVLATANGQLAAEPGNASHAVPTGCSNNDPLLTHLERLDDRLRPLILAKDYWDNVVTFVQFRLEQP
jgi:hypothetical protein